MVATAPLFGIICLHPFLSTVAHMDGDGRAGHDQMVGDFPIAARVQVCSTERQDGAASWRVF